MTTFRAQLHCTNCNLIRKLISWLKTIFLMCKRSLIKMVTIVPTQIDHNSMWLLLYCAKVNTIWMKHLHSFRHFVISKDIIKSLFSIKLLAIQSLDIHLLSFIDYIDRFIVGTRLEAECNQAFFFHSMGIPFFVRSLLQMHVLRNISKRY